MTFAEVHVKRSVILTDRLGPDILLVLAMKRQVLHRERAHVKVPGCSLVLSALLTKKLPTFLSRLNEISGGCEKILPVSGSFCILFDRHYERGLRYCDVFSKTYLNNEPLELSQCFEGVS